MSQEHSMSLSTAVIVNVALAATALGALAVVCRLPFRLGGKHAELRAHSQLRPASIDPQARLLTEVVPQPPQ
jgi:hypothetical protein